MTEQATPTAASNSDPIETTSPAANQDLFELLRGGDSGPGVNGGKRSQLKTDDKRRFAGALAAASGIREEHISIRALNDDKQTGRASAETIAERVRADVEMLDWVFIGRCTGPSETYPAIIRYMTENANVLAGISLFIGADPTWRVIALFYDKELESEARRISSFLQYNFDEASETEVRDRRNLTKHITETVVRSSDDIFLEDDLKKKLISEALRKRCIILQGPPGTGKTVVAKQLAKHLAKEDDYILSSQFHPSYSYEDFIRGWRPDNSGTLTLADGAFIKFCDKARGDPQRLWVSFIDEINRANISQVFGEMLSLLEVSKRDPSYAVNLAYMRTAEEPFFIPPNVVLIGTMNTADRSLALVDYALRRRFSFIDLRPSYGSELFIKYQKSQGIPEAAAREISRRFIELNEAISNDLRNLGPGYELGHSYFCTKPDENADINDWYKDKINFEIAPLLREYWMEEPLTADEHISTLSAPLPTGD